MHYSNNNKVICFYKVSIFTTPCNKQQLWRHVWRNSKSAKYEIFLRSRKFGNKFLWLKCWSIFYHVESISTLLRNDILVSGCDTQFKFVWRFVLVVRSRQRLSALRQHSLVIRTTTTAPRARRCLRTRAKWPNRYRRWSMRSRRTRNIRTARAAKVNWCTLPRCFYM